MATIQDFKKAEKRFKRKEWIQKRKNDIHNFVSNNKEEIKVVVPVVVAGLTATASIVGKIVKHDKEKNLVEKTCYDRSLGHYWQLKRKPSNQEWLEVDRRKKNGERLADILSDMRLLK